MPDDEIKNTISSQMVLLPAQETKEQGMTLTDLFLIFWRRKIFIAGLTLLCTLISVYMVLYKLPILYKAEMTVYVSSPLNPMSAIAGGMGSGDLGGMISLFARGLSGAKSDFLEQVLKSRVMKEKMINKFNLLPRIFYKLWDEEKQGWDVDDPEDIPTVAAAAMEGALDDYYLAVQDKQTGFIRVVFWDQDPAFAVKVVAWVGEELERFLDQDFVTDAKLNRIFVEEQYERIKKEVAHWERTRPGSEVPSSEIERELQASLMAYLKVREQLELAKILEDRELINFKVLDPPLSSGLKDKPKRKVICGLTLIVSGFMSIVLALLMEFVGQMRKKAKMEKRAADRGKETLKDDEPGQKPDAPWVNTGRKEIPKANNYGLSDSKDHGVG